MDWLTHEIVTDKLVSKHHKSLEMVILSNQSAVAAATGDDDDNNEHLMRLGMDTLQYLIDTCPRLCCVGNLKTWAGIDYYDPQSEHYYQSGDQSQLGKLKQTAIKKNWNLDLDSENLDYLYTNK